MLFSLISVPFVYAENVADAPDGTEDAPFLIDSAESFLDFLKRANNESGDKIYYALVNDIEASPELGSIGGYVGYDIGFDGNGHELKGFEIESYLFESLTDCTFRNVTFNNVSVKAMDGGADVAIIAKDVDSSTFITGCTFKGCTVSLPAGPSEVNGAVVAVNNGGSITNTVIENTTVFEQTATGISSDVRYNIGGIVTNNIGYGYIVNAVTAPVAALEGGPEYRFAGAAVYSETNIAYCYSKVSLPENVQIFDPHVAEASGQYAKEDFWVIGEGDSFTVIGGEDKDYSSMSLMELSAELSELSMNEYNLRFQSSLHPEDYASLWSVENSDLSLSKDGKTGSVYVYLNDAPLKNATITFSDTVYTEEIAKNEKYAVRVGTYGEDGAYERNTFEISLYTKDFTMVENFVYRPNQSYVKFLPNEMDGEYDATYSDMLLNSHNNGSDEAVAADIFETGIKNRAVGSVYPFCTTISLTNISSCDEIVDYRFQGNGTDDAPFLINNFYEIECLSSHVKKEKLYYGTERFNRASYRLARDVYYPEDQSVLHEPIGGYSSDLGRAFSGSFDGDYHVIGRVTVSSSNSYTGFFGVVAGVENTYDYSYATIKRVSFDGINVNDTNHELPGDLRGCLAGQISHTVVNGCFVNSASSVTGGTQLGGIVGYAYNSELYNCASFAKINTYHPNAWAGGLVGYSQYSTVANGYAANLFTTNNVVDEATLLIGGISGSVKNTEFDNTFYRNDNSADPTIVFDGITAVGLSDIRTASFAAELTYYSETHGLGVVWSQDSDYNDQYPYITSSENADYMIFCVPTNYGKVVTLDSEGNEIFTANSNDIIRIKKEGGLVGIKIENYSKTLLDLAVSTVTVAEEEYFEFMMPDCAIRITPDYGKPALSGCGTREEPYMISGYGDLVLMSELINSNTSPKLDGCDPYLDAYYVVTQDIDCEGQTLNSIANTNSGSTSIRFGGDFNGCGHTISNLKIESGNSYVAFFGHSQDAEIYDIKFDNVEVNGYYTTTLVAMSYGYLAIRNVEVTNTTLNGSSTAAGFVGQSYATLNVTNCILDNITYNSPSTAYVLYECDEYVSFNIKNTLILNMSDSRKVVDLSWSTSSVNVENVYHCNALMTSSKKYTVTEISEETLNDTEFIASLTGYSIDKLGESSWGIRKNDLRASLAVLDDTTVVSPITYDSVFTESELELFNMETAPTYACEGDTVKIRYNLRASTANVKAEVGNGNKKKATKCLFDGIDNGDGYGIMTFNMPSEKVNFSNNDEPVLMKELLGRGTADEPYEIHNAADLRHLAEVVNGLLTQRIPDDSYVEYSKSYVRLACDIDMKGAEWTPIASFSGTFDGNGHSITDLNVNATASNAGLFGSVNGTVKDLAVSGSVTVSANGVRGVGVIGVLNNGGRAQGLNSFVDITVSNGIGETAYIGGVVGTLWGGVVTECAYYGNITLGDTSVDQTGGIVGYVEYNGTEPTITNCGYYGMISTANTSNSIGGIMGYSRNGGLTLTNCLSVGDLPDSGDAVTAFGVINRSPKSISHLYYLEGSAPRGTANSGDHSYIPADGVVNAETEEQLASGEIAYKLGSAFGQILEGESRQEYPVVNGARVYCGYDSCADDAVMVYTNDENICTEKPAHTEEILPGKAPTCTESGLTDGVKCSVCDKILSEQEEIPLESHTGGNATCTEQARCEVCGAAYGETGDHNWVDGICTYDCGTVHDPHTYENGKCTVCGAEDNRVLMGDINSDGIVNAMDVNIVNRILSGSLTPTAEQIVAGDMNGDARINGMDANILARIVAGAAD